MTRIRLDQLAKQYLDEFLEPLGNVQCHPEVPGESKFVDVWFTPSSNSTSGIALTLSLRRVVSVWFTPNSNSAPTPIDLGLLSQIATTPCLLEPFRNAPTPQDIRACLFKLLWMQEDQRRKIEQNQGIQTEEDLHWLWILAANVSPPVIREFGGRQRPDRLPGIYFLPEAYMSAIVALDELPLTPETLWLRILGRNETQQQALVEILAMPKDDPQRSTVLQLLTNWRTTVEITGNLDEEERSLMTTLSQIHLE